MSYRPKVIKVLTDEDRSYYSAADVQKILGIGRSKSYDLIRSLRQEMFNQGILTPDYPEGKIPKSYFNRRCGIEPKKEVNRCITENALSAGVI